MQTTQTDRRTPRPSATTPTLHILFSGSAGVVGRSIALPIGVTLVGRDVAESEGIALRLDERLSRRHVSLEISKPPAESSTVEPHLVRVLDLGSKNHTFVNGEQVVEASLRDGDVLRIGNSFLMLRHQPGKRSDAVADPLFGLAPTICTLRTQIVQAAKGINPILLQGETGAGKEVAACALHKASGRPGPFIAVNCSAVPENLAESLFFGHVEGAFSDAKKGQLGYFRAADGGTLFLDEIGEMPASLQPKLLRALEERAVTPVGTTRSVCCDVRVVAATNRNLWRAAQTGAFRQDLYARLAGVILEVPPLRSRREDILPILLRALAPTGQPPRFSGPLVEALLLYHWPLNVRELLQMADALRPYLETEPELDLPLVSPRFHTQTKKPRPRVASPAAADCNIKPSIDMLTEPEPPTGGPRLSQETLERLFNEEKGNISKLAHRVGRSRRQVRRWLEHYGILPRRL